VSLHPKLNLRLRSVLPAVPRQAVAEGVAEVADEGVEDASRL
jgi:hypothetical protein